jgi:hypothetical protein
MSIDYKGTRRGQRRERASQGVKDKMARQVASPADDGAGLGSLFRLQQPLVT